ncbi:hypothetical protein [Bartonella henselae]|nr:hypothetical protein [Bartonella henselae]ATP12886.1 hypothetical protein BhenCHDE101_07510 [Bartonella henselae]MDM9991301.1 hypothetical protein [Bartonella henselae]OLL46434.1 hypothetical protein AT242_07220 [Bartonella henselae]PNM38996.1 hypothetical protein AL470_006820 [Bartonella henselae str. Houston-1]UAK83885.1 hypothetical protein K8O99_06255 [Bartonella henselae]
MTAWGKFSQSCFYGEAPIGGRAMKSNAFKMIFLLSQKRTILLESIEKYSSFHIVPLFFNLPFLADHLLAFVIFKPVLRLEEKFLPGLVCLWGTKSGMPNPSVIDVHEKPQENALLFPDWLFYGLVCEKKLCTSL